MSMFHLTTRANALARVTIGGANITATTALQVRAGRVGPGGGWLPIRLVSTERSRK
jgi:hypothetical protein